jgi:hypothetical protein
MPLPVVTALVRNLIRVSAAVLRSRVAGDPGTLGTDWSKPFLETAPAVIVVFEVHKGPDSPRPYYTKESVGIAVGLLLAALHQAGLATLTHTPSPMRFLNDVCDRPSEERAAYVIPAGYPVEDARVPDIRRKALEQVMVRL